jgi:hypothetical protein
MNILKFPPALATKTKCSAVSHPGSIGRVLAAILIVLTLVGFGERVARAQDSTIKNDAGVDMAVEGIHCTVVGGPRQLADWISADALRDKRGQVEFVCGSGVIFRCHAVAIKP